MAQVFETSVAQRSVTLYTLLPEEIVIARGLTGRKEQTEIEALAADILAHGQNTPVLIRKNDAGDPVLVYGHRRVQAIAHINKTLKAGEKLRVQAKYEKLDENEALIAAIGENRFRTDVSPIDDSFNINKLIKHNKLSLEAIAEIYFPEAKSANAKAEALRWVKTRAALDELAPEAKEAVREGVATVTAAAELAKLPHDKQREVLAKSTSKLKGTARIKVADVKAAKSAPKPAAKPVAVASVPKVASSVYEAAEILARALDFWIEDATEKAEKGVIAAHKAYRKLVPLKVLKNVEADDKAA